MIKPDVSEIVLLSIADELGAMVSMIYWQLSSLIVALSLKFSASESVHLYICAWSWRVKSEKSMANKIGALLDRKSTRLNSSHVRISYAVFCLKKKKKNK